MTKIEGRQIGALAKTLYGIELSAARADMLGEVIGTLSDGATKAVGSLPMETEPALFEIALETCRMGASR